MKLHVVFALVSGGIGGGQRVALAVARQLRHEGYRISATAPDGGVSLDRFRALGAKTIITGPVRSYDLIVARRLRRFFLTHNVGCVYSHTVPVHESILGLATRSSTTRYVIHRHSVGTFSEHRGRRAVQKPVWGKALRWADEIICVSNELVKHVQQVADVDVTVIPNGVPIPMGLTMKYDKQPVVGYVGRLDENKRIVDFLRAAELVKERCAGTRFVVVGEGVPNGSYERYCRALSRDLGLNDVVSFTGNLASTDAVMSEIDVLVLPSVLDFQPMILLEAMALGKAVVATDIPGCREVVEENVSGRLVPPKSPDALARAIQELLDSPSERARLGAGARDRIAKDFSEEKMLDRIIPLVVGL